MVAKKLSGVHRICHLLGVSKRTYYQAQAPETRREQKYQWLKIKVKTIIEAHTSYGVRWIKADLSRRYGIAIGRDTLSRLLKLWSLDMKRAVKSHPVSGVSKILCYLSERANLLKRVVIMTPFRAMTTDMSEIIYAYGKEKTYLCIHKDVYGQMVYGYAVGSTMESSLVIASFKKACATIITLLTHVHTPHSSQMICYQDRGSQYTSYNYTSAVLSSGMRLSYSDPGTPTDNPGQESFFGRFKDEHTHDMYEIATLEALQCFINTKIVDYNEERLHTRIGYIPPCEFTRSFLSDRRIVV
jgi:transposase InsO family protein